MPHRDPETGQFLADDHTGTFADADQILHLHRHLAFGDTSVTNIDYGEGNTPATVETLEIQKDYRILGIEVKGEMRTQNADVAVNSPSQPIQMRASLQLGTTGSYNPPDGPGAGGAQGIGTYWHDEFAGSVAQVWDDDTNGNAAVIPGHDYNVDERWPAEKLVNVDVTPDAGTTINVHLDVAQGGGTSEGMVLDYSVRIYVAERSDN